MFLYKYKNLHQKWGYIMEVVINTTFEYMRIMLQKMMKNFKEKFNNKWREEKLRHKYLQKVHAYSSDIFQNQAISHKV